MIIQTKIAFKSLEQCFQRGINLKHFPLGSYVKFVVWWRRPSWIFRQQQQQKFRGSYKEHSNHI